MTHSPVERGTCRRGSWSLVLRLLQRADEGELIWRRREEQVGAPLCNFSYCYVKQSFLERFEY
ncbi:hypothetical protein TorRG33x02_235550 [Trema orientale]|uniref:Uncharacterized protein n=1 Tax=Trema orientale TaxID=63057 RepID=A0A2P5E1X5_TREOI|nr:hypothetical protein TorRG33x02_235550 [Trema orientale]